MSEQPNQHSFGKTGRESIAHQTNNQRSSSDSVDLGFEPVSDHNNKQQILRHPQSEPQAQRQFEKSARLWAFSPVLMREHESTHSELRIPAMRQFRYGFHAEKNPHMNSEVACATKQEKNFNTINSSQLQESFSEISETPNTEAVNLKGAQQLQPISLRNPQIESNKLDPNLRFNFENSIAFFRRKCRWPASLHH